MAALGLERVERDTAYAFDATSQEAIWIVGPLLVLLSVSTPEAAVLTSEAFAWTSSAYALGISLGAASAGALAQLLDLHAAFVLASAGSGLAWAAALALADRSAVHQNA